MRIGKYRIVDKIRFSISILMISIMMIIVFSAFSHSFTANAINKTEYIDVVVRPGDTIWKIAKKYTDDERDIREVIYVISKINEIDNSMIYSGQVLKIPSYNKKHD
jgi:nucleoid-associated protein YgaU